MDESFPHSTLGHAFTEEEIQQHHLLCLSGQTDVYSVYYETHDAGTRHCYYLCDRLVIIALVAYKELAQALWSVLIEQKER